MNNDIAQKMEENASEVNPSIPPGENQVIAMETNENEALKKTRNIQELRKRLSPARVQEDSEEETPQNAQQPNLETRRFHFHDGATTVVMDYYYSDRGPADFAALLDELEYTYYQCYKKKINPMEIALSFGIEPPTVEENRPGDSELVEKQDLHNSIREKVKNEYLEEAFQVDNAEEISPLDKVQLVQQVQQLAKTKLLGAIEAHKLLFPRKYNRFYLVGEFIQQYARFLDEKTLYKFWKILDSAFDEEQFNSVWKGILFQVRNERILFNFNLLLHYAFNREVTLETLVVEKLNSDFEWDQQHDPTDFAIADVQREFRLFHMGEFHTYQLEEFSDFLQQYDTYMHAQFEKFQNNHAYDELDEIRRQLIVYLHQFHSSTFQFGGTVQRRIFLVFYSQPLLWSYHFWEYSRILIQRWRRVLPEAMSPSILEILEKNQLKMEDIFLKSQEKGVKKLQNHFKCVEELAKSRAVMMSIAKDAMEKFNKETQVKITKLQEHGTSAQVVNYLEMELPRIIENHQGDNRCWTTQRTVSVEEVGINIDRAMMLIGDKLTINTFTYYYYYLMGVMSPHSFFYCILYPLIQDITRINKFDYSRLPRNEQDGLMNWRISESETERNIVEKINNTSNNNVKLNTQSGNFIQLSTNITQVAKEAVKNAMEELKAENTRSIPQNTALKLENDRKWINYDSDKSSEDPVINTSTEDRKLKGLVQARTMNLIGMENELHEMKRQIAVIKEKVESPTNKSLLNTEKLKAQLQEIENELPRGNQLSIATSVPNSGRDKTFINDRIIVAQTPTKQQAVIQHTARVIKTVEDIPLNVITPLRLDREKSVSITLPEVVPIFTTLREPTTASEPNREESIVTEMRRMTSRLMEPKYIPIGALPTYDGTDKMSAFSFAREFLEYAKTRAMEPESSISLLHHCLIGNAKEWWRGYQNLLKGKTILEISLESILKDLVSHYDTDSKAYFKRSRVEEIRQEENEGIANYLAKFSSAMVEYPKEISEVDQIYYLYKGLSTYYKDRMNIDEIVSLNELKRKLTQLERGKKVHSATDYSKQLEKYAADTTQQIQDIKRLIRNNESFRPRRKELSVNNLETEEEYQEEEEDVSVNVITSDSSRKNIKDPFIPPKSWQPTNRKPPVKATRDYSRMKCYNCGELGHSYRRCQKQKVEEIVASNQAKDTNTNTPILNKEKSGTATPTKQGN
jgi:hypothetical protein